MFAERASKKKMADGPIQYACRTEYVTHSYFQKEAKFEIINSIIF